MFSGLFTILPDKRLQDTRSRNVKTKDSMRAANLAPRLSVIQQAHDHSWYMLGCLVMAVNRSPQLSTAADHNLGSQRSGDHKVKFRNRLKRELPTQALDSASLPEHPLAKRVDS